MLTYILVLLASFVICYLAGSVNFAILVSKFVTHDDVRNHGSGNAGMTNVIRTVGKKAGAVTFIGDMLKGVVALLLTKYLLIMPAWAASDIKIELISPEYAAYMCALFCLLGHAYPVFFQFRGGKCAATSIGLLFCINWQAACFVLATFLILLLITKIVSVSSIMGAAEWIVYSFIYAADKGLAMQLYTTFLAALLGALVIFKHKENIGRLRRGEEKMITSKK